MRTIAPAQRMTLALFGFGALLDASFASAQSLPATPCQARLHKITGDYLKCRLDVEASLLTLRGVKAYKLSEGTCDRLYERRYSRELDHSSGACRRSGESETETQEQLTTAVDATIGRVKWIVAGTPPAAEPGKVILFNNCSQPLKFMSPTNPSTIDGIVLGSGEAKHLDISEFNQSAPNTILAAPQTTASQCGLAACQNWTSVQPNTTQRAGYMWEAPNQVWATYCQPTNAAASQCTSDPASTPCCGPNMNYDKTFGTLLEFSPSAGTSRDQDFINLSTNYGSGPHSPPLLCGPGVDPNNCVTASANIFFTVPVKVDLSSGGACSCGALGHREQLVCGESACGEAYQFPEDDKQCACSSGGTRGYVVTYCPAGSPLPGLPTPL